MDLELRDKMKQKGWKRLLKSFKYALDGIHYAFRYEQNIIVHFLATVVVVIAGMFFKISYTEWLICLIVIGLVIATELLNTAIEAVVDLACPKIDPLAKIAKDTASGAVLVFATVAIVVGFLIFVPKIIEYM